MAKWRDGGLQGLWSGLPEHLVEDVLEELLGGASNDEATLPDLMAACGVCKAWRPLAMQRFFKQPWDAGPRITHPLQLFSLSSRAMEGGLLKCFVTRDRLRGRQMGASRLCLYLGTGADDPEAKFLLGALQSSRMMAPMGGVGWETSIYLNKECTGKPVARLASSWMSTRYSLEPTPHCLTPVEPAAGPRRAPVSPRSGLDQDFDSLSIAEREASLVEGNIRCGFAAKGGAVADACAVPAGVPPKLAMVQYSKRVQGFMRPRKIRVALPHPSELACFENEPGIATRLGTDSGEGAPVDSSGDERSAGGYRKGTSSGGGRRLTLLESVRHSTAVAGEGLARPSSSLDMGLSDSGADTMLRDHPQPRRPLLLKNKLPRWNAGLRCWCLNFRSRVKLASVKNFQLQCCDSEMADALAAAASPAPGHDPAAPPLSRERRLRQVIMQFGKASSNVYIMDYNPTVISAVQAFGIALSTFDGKLRM